MFLGLAPSPARVETPADIIHVSNTELRNSSQKDEEPKSASLLSRIKRSMSLTSESTAFALYARNDKQRTSTFYLTDPINVDITESSTEEETGNRISKEKSEEKVEMNGSVPDNNRNLKKSKLSRPKSPPPPVPVVMGKFLQYTYFCWNLFINIFYMSQFSYIFFV